MKVEAEKNTGRNFETNLMESVRILANDESPL